MCITWKFIFCTRERKIEPRKVRWAGHVARVGEMRNAYESLVIKPEGKRLFGAPRRTREDNTEVDLENK
jgi:hypothetical protein